ncbi:Gldg family protein [Chitinophaga pollutisoli]|uniref:Gldg family protein n=1 Tax=Chitinophaga pollutisoli TaxID=3133966 RepID=A0ABZ2YR93_9BACT
MKKIFNIARVELSNQFYSPIAWLLLIIFTVHCGISFSEVLNNMLTGQQMSRLYPASPMPLTSILLASPRMGLFSVVLDKMFLYLPLLTMGLISREVSSGAIRLLYSSPVRTSQIVLGKFMAMVMYNLLLVAILGAFAAVTCMIIPHADAGLALMGLAVVLLLLSTYAAIGLFMSSLTAYQVVAALSTLAVFAFLQYVGKVWQDIDLVRDITYHLSLGSRSQDMLDGLVSSRDILYFLIITAAFISFTILRLKSEQEHKPGWLRATRYIAVMVTVLVLVYATSRPKLTAYLDVTSQQTQTLSNYMQELLKSTGDEPLQLTAYVNLLDPRYSHGAARERNKYLHIWEKYTRFKPIDYKFFYYYDTSNTNSYGFERTYRGKTLDSAAYDFARIYDVSLEGFNKPEIYRQFTHLKEEDAKMVLELKYKGKTSLLRMFDDREVWPSEAQFAASLKRLTAPNSIQKIGFLEGQLQREWNTGGQRNYANFSTVKEVRAALINNGFDITSVAGEVEIPKDLKVLIVSDPKTAFSTSQLDIMRRYINNGGNLLITTEPGKGEVTKPLLDMLGLEVMPGTLVASQPGEVPDLLQARLTKEAGGLSQGVAGLYYNNAAILLPGAAALDYQHAAEKGFLAEPLLVSNNHQWLKMGPVVKDSAAVVFDEAGGDTSGIFAPVVALSRKTGGREQRIIVAGDGDFLSNAALMLYGRSNFPFVTGLFKWFSNDIFPVELPTKAPKDARINLSDKGFSGIKLAFIWVLPVVVVLFAIVLLIRRKRK